MAQRDESGQLSPESQLFGVAFGAGVYGDCLFRSANCHTAPVAAGERFELLSRNPMGAPVFATPAVAGTTLIVRTASDVFGITG